MNKISIVIPCFNEEEALPVYYEEMSRIMKQMQGVDFELLFVDDGSSDRTLGIMKSLHERDERCKYLSFSRNFGKEAAIYAGLSNAEGNYVAIMDVDLQDPPSLLPEMYRTLIEEPYDSVATKRSTRTLSLIHIYGICSCRRKKIRGSSNYIYSRRRSNGPADCD